MSLQQLPLETIRAAENQPRKTFYQESLEELAASIRERGVLEPIVVRPVADKAANGAIESVRYEIVMGERRFRASKIAGLATIPAIVRTDMSDEEVLADALLENFQREDLNPVEKARAVAGLLQIMSREKVCQTLGVSDTTVRRLLDILELPLLVQAELIYKPVGGSGTSAFGEGHARALIPLNHDVAVQAQMVTKVKEERMSVARLEMLVGAILKYPAKARIFLHVPSHIADQMMRSLGAHEEKQKPFRAQTAQEHVRTIDRHLAQVADVLDERVMEFLTAEQMGQLLAVIAQAEAHLQNFGTRVRDTMHNQDSNFREHYMHCPLCGRIELVNTTQCSVCYSTLKRCADCGNYNSLANRCMKRNLPIVADDAEFPKPTSTSARCMDYEPRFVPQVINVQRMLTEKRTPR